MNREESLGPSAVFELGEPNDAYAKYFIGQSYLKHLTTEGVGVVNVTFEPGCRNNWHIHHKGGQILIVTGGKGYYQEWGKPVQCLKPGDIVNIPPEIKHWHGAGKVHYLGASSMYAWQFQKAQYLAEKNGWTKFSVMQGHYNLLYREEEREMIPLCKDMKVALVPYSPLAAGRLTRDWNSDSKRAQEDLVAKRKYDSTVDTDRKIVERVAEIADKYQVTKSQVAVAWLWAKGVTAPIVGITKEKYLDDFAGALTVKLTQEDIEYLEECYQPHVIMGHN